MKKLLFGILATFLFFSIIDTKAKASGELPVLEISPISVGEYTVDFSIKYTNTDFDGEVVLKSGKTVLGSTQLYSFSSFETIFSDRNFYLNEKLDFYFVDEEGNETFLISEFARDYEKPEFDEYYVNDITIRSTTVTGKYAEVGTNIEVKIGKKTYKGIVSKYGTYSVKIPKQKVNTKIKVRSVDASKNASGYVEKTVDTPSGTYVNSNDVTVKSTKVTGRVTKNIKGDLVKVIIGKKVYKGKIDKKHKFSMKIPKQKARKIIKVYYIDSLGSTIDTDSERVYTSKYVKIGMTKSQVLDTEWGKPDDINTTINAYYTWEQWVYGWSSYLYFKNGKLVSIDN